MARFRKRPVVVEAWRFLLEARYPWREDDMFLLFPVKWDTEENCPYLEIETLEGLMRANNGDWIIRGVNGEYYPCKPDVFSKTYEQETA
jgi:hypothetical protein